ncbi:hypothetical protein MMC25_008046 [Agyrium rufum]|nr:hypothetical protein [Agyrium rufum]
MAHQVPAAGAAVSVPQVIDNVWTYMSAQINAGTINNIRLPVAFKTVIGQQGMETLANRFEHLIQAPVTMYEDHGTGLIRMIPTRNPRGKRLQSESIVPKPGTLTKAKVPRPPNAFILYRQHHHPLIKADNPDIHNNQISIILGTQWKNESDKTKSYWKRMAEELKQQHLVENPEYSYQPRKPADRKRRMTHKKALVLAAISSQNLRPSQKNIIGAHAHVANLLELEKTPAGNIVIDLGNDDLDEAALAVALDVHNTKACLPINLATATMINRTPSVIYHEYNEDAQNDVNFYSSMIDWEAVDQDVKEMYKSFNMRMQQGEATFRAALTSSTSGFSTSSHISRFDDTIAVLVENEYQRAQRNFAAQ